MNIGIRQDDKGMFWADVQTDEGKISGEKSICWDGAIESLCAKLHGIADEIKKQTEAWGK